MSSGDTASRLGFALLGYMLSVTLIVTLVPFRFDAPEQWHVMLTGNVTDFVANILLFVPLGFLYRLARPSPTDRFGVSVLFIGALVSALIEAAQLFSSARNASALDVVANAAGAWLGAWAFDRVTRHGTKRAHVLGSLSLELPIMGLIYLLVPLLWVSSLASGGDIVRRSAVLLLGVFGAILIGGVQRRYVGSGERGEPVKAAIFAALWFLAGTFPLLPRKPFYLAIATVSVGAVCWLIARRSVLHTHSDRRFEVPLLRSAAPFYAAYLVLIIGAPLYGEAGTWRLAVGFPGIASRQIEIVRLLELVAAATLVGYMVAEVRGRRMVSLQALLTWLAGCGTALAISIEAVRGFQPGYGASVTRGVLLALAAVYGGWLYYLQRAHAVELLSRTTDGRTMR
jgi:VanZ family protein